MSSDLRALDAALKKQLAALKVNKLELYKPYKRQKQFHQAGSFYPYRLLQAGNRQGKTEAGAMEVAMHLTGLYPRWWKGRKFDRENHWWAAGDSLEALRSGIIEKFLGTSNPISMTDMVGTGAIPKELILKVIPGRGGAESVDTIIVKHVSGGQSTVKMKTYQQERGVWQGATLDGIWFDEEPPLELFSEGSVRVATKKGIVILTFTPLKGRSQVVNMFYDSTNKMRTVIHMGPEDCDHWTKEMEDQIMAGQPPYQYDCRVRGLIAKGEGAVWALSPDIIPPIPISPYWRLIAGIDFGINERHKAAVAWLAHDCDTDIVYLFRTFRQADLDLAGFAAAVNAGGRGIPVSWPQDGYEREKSSKVSVADQLRKDPYNLKLLPDHAKWQDGSNSHEGFVMAMQTRLELGKFKVFNTCMDFMDEFNGYHRKDDKIVKERDDLISAVKVAMMSLRFAQPVDRLGATRGRLDGGSMGRVLDIDVFTGRTFDA